jgi:pimeloyl-ACP methyl ester carboxylesterase/class 3 adenylate cyclase
MTLQKPPTLYAESDGLKIAYQVVGDGDIDVVFVPGFVSNIDAMWLGPPSARFGLERFAKFGRVIFFDKRGTGVSDPIEGAPSLEQRMDDLRAVMDAAGSKRAALCGFSEGAPMCLLFAATYPERVASLSLVGAMARSTWAPDYPYAAPAEDLLESAALFSPYWGQGAYLEMFAPSIIDHPDALEAWAQHERFGAPPDQMAKLYLMFLEIDVRHVLPTISVPTLVLHKRGDRVVSVHGARWMAAQIPGARMVEFPGVDHSWGVPGGEDFTPMLDAIEEFITGVRPVSEPDRVLATVMFTDIVSSTEKAAQIGDHRWKELLDDHERRIRVELGRFRGTEVKTTGDGFLATFDGPARAIHCAHAITEAVRRLGLEARVGLHSGEIDLRGWDVAGIAVHIASRVGSLARPSEVLVSETVKGLVAGSGITFEERGEHELKGVPETWRLYAVRP